MAADIGIVETRAFTKLMKEKKGWDFSEFSITFLKRRLEAVTSQIGYRDCESLLKRLENDEDFYNMFLEDFIPSCTEMFRDPSLWRLLKDKVIPDLFENTSRPIKIWIASFDSGEDIYSLAILLKEMNMLSSVKIFASEYSETKSQKIKDGLLDSNKMDLNIANYERFNGKAALNAYYTMTPDGAVRFNRDLVKDVVFVKQNTNFDNSVAGCKLILFRNQLIYMNISQEEKVIGSIKQNLMPGSCLVIGVKESLEHLSCNNQFLLSNSTEKVYKLKIG